jgi:acyl carrier protein
MLKEELEQTIVELVCKYNEQPYDAQLKDQPIVNFRLDSVNAVSIVSDLEKKLDTELFPTLFWEFDTISEMTDWIIERGEG